MPRKYKVEQSSGYTVLLVDDDPEYLEATRLLLEREGHHVLAAADGPAALDLLQKEPIDLLLLDYFMPGLNGRQAYEKIKEIDNLVKIFFVTGNVEQLENIEDDNIIGTMKKPFEYKTLLEIIDENSVKQ